MIGDTTSDSPASLGHELLREINQRIGATGSIVELVDFVFARIPALLPCDRIGLAYVEEDGRRLVSHYSVANYAPILLKKGFGQDLQGSSLEAVIREGRPRILNDLPAYYATKPSSGSTALIVREGIRSSLTCPLLIDGRAIGVLFFSSCQKDAYDESHIQLHQTIAERLAQAAEKAFRIEQLEQANRAYMEVLGFVVHELKSPVAAMITNARLLLDGYLGDISQPQREKIDRIAQKGEYLIGLIKDYLDLAHVENAESTTPLGTLDDFAAEVIQPSLELVQEQIEASGMVLSCQFETSGALPGDAALLRIVVVNLLGNAVKYGKPDGELRVRLYSATEGIEFAVWNEGPGFPPEKRGELFRRFSRLNTPELLRQKGTGIGLYTCWKIIQRHAGRIWAESEHGRWACFSFFLPRQAQLPQANIMEP